MTNFTGKRQRAVPRHVDRISPHTGVFRLHPVTQAGSTRLMLFQSDLSSTEKVAREREVAADEASRLAEARCAFMYQRGLRARWRLLERAAGPLGEALQAPLYIFKAPLFSFAPVSLRQGSSWWIPTNEQLTSLLRNELSQGGTRLVRRHVLFSKASQTLLTTAQDGK